MLEHLLAAGAILLGFVALIWGSDKFVEGAATTARLLNMPALLIGLTIVALGTSAPEMLVSALAAIQNQTGLAVGNATGSNIANIAMILGFTAIFMPMVIRSKMVWGELVAMLAVTGIAAWFLLSDNELSRMDGMILLLLLIPATLWMFWLSKRNSALSGHDIDDDDIDEINTDLGLSRALGILAIGLVVLLIGSQGVVYGAKHFAISFRISDAIIGATVVAIGTSLPELGATFAAARRKEFGMAIGNVLGSNLYNIMAVLGIAGVIGPAQLAGTSIEADSLLIQVVVMMALSLIMTLLLLRPNGNGGINRWQGGALSLVFIAFIAYSAVQASQQII